ncbi:MAG TPA: bifunctional diaminohydroxyphosphoribosylaminopyrimidine deaminase/5-amino-6-(5-phosphoribosylamino)uracil reductase RibD [Phycisphaerales bacterium]|nr:bifunctional diaminohydroxyphosphoribosylaminopyrimidine deaminase/5-amino-6-(5-phosphoribosylamino)uracil reductase RibD [Phycisphaerales bacterium]
MRRALELARHGWGTSHPNPMVGCVIADARGRVIGAGHHRVFGGAHAEVEGLDACRRSGADPRGGTAWVTLEPCNHTGKTGACSEAIIRAGLARVVIARRDANPVAAGGAARLVAAGVRVEFCSASALASGLASPFLARVALGRPWVIAKWAQTIDGRMATGAGVSKWISSERSRRRVHRLRGMVDCVMTGIGTVLADDPLLTCRGVRARRVARRVVVDTRLRTPVGARLVGSAREAPLTILSGSEAGAAALRGAGAEVRALPPVNGRIDLAGALRWLLAERGVATVLLEAGPRLLGRFLEEGLVDEAMVFVAPRVLGDPSAHGPDRGVRAPTLDAAPRLCLVRTRRVGDDVLLHYRRAEGVHLPVGAP